MRRFFLSILLLIAIMLFGPYLLRSIVGVKERMVEGTEYLKFSKPKDSNNTISNKDSVTIDTLAIDTLK